MRCLHPLVSTWAESINFPSSVNCEIMYDVDIRKPGNEEINQLFSFKRSKPQALLGSRKLGITLNQITSWVDWKVICFFCLVLLNMHADYLIISDMKKDKNRQCYYLWKGLDCHYEWFRFDKHGFAKVDFRKWWPEILFLLVVSKYEKKVRWLVV